MTFEVDCRFDNCECVIEDTPVGRVCRHMERLNLDHPPPGYQPLNDKGEKERASAQPGIKYTDNEWWPQWCCERQRPRDR